MRERDALVAQLRESLDRESARAPQVDLTGPCLQRAGQIRGRRRAGAAAAVVLVGVGVPVGTGIGILDRTDRDPDVAVSDRSPSPSTQPHVLARDALLTDRLINPVGGYSGFERFESASMSQDRLANQCLPGLAAVPAEETQVGTWFSSRNNGTVVEYVLQMPTTDEARELVDEQRSLPDRCGTVTDTQEQLVHQPGEVTVPTADEGLAWSVEVLPGSGSQEFWDGVGMARSGNVVVVLAFSGDHDPTDGVWDAWTTDALGRALEKAF